MVFRPWLDGALPGRASLGGPDGRSDRHGCGKGRVALVSSRLAWWNERLKLITTVAQVLPYHT